MMMHTCFLTFSLLQGGTHTGARVSSVVFGVKTKSLATDSHTPSDSSNVKVSLKLDHERTPLLLKKKFFRCVSNDVSVVQLHAGA